jgi:hypothetical protein
MGDERVKAEALQILGLFQVLPPPPPPPLVVFDLDYTLWPFYWSVPFPLSLSFSQPSLVGEKLPVL